MASRCLSRASSLCADTDLLLLSDEIGTRQRGHLLTIRDLLDGKKIDMPLTRGMIRTDKAARVTQLSVGVGQLSLPDDAVTMASSTEEGNQMEKWEHLVARAVSFTDG